jgi:cytochrome c
MGVIYMKNQMSVLIGILFIFGFASTSIASGIQKGQKTYFKKCKICHGNGTQGSSMQTQSKWTKLFNNNAEKIIKAHNNTDAKEYFNGERFIKRAPYLKEFLWQYGSDSGNVPSCG